MKRVVTRSPEETRELGREFANTLHPGDVVALVGELGTGKTLFASGVCRGLGAAGHTGSPTFTLIHEYPAPFGAVIHVDLYRTGSRREIRELALEDYYSDRTICLIEWAERAEGLLPARHLTVRIAYGTGDTERVFEMPETEEARR